MIRLHTVQLFLAFTVVFLATLATPAQQPSIKRPADLRITNSAPEQPAVAVPNRADTTRVELRSVPGKLVDKLDTKSTQTGEALVIKTTEKATTADGMVIPKGSRLTGHVTEVQAHDGGNENARMTLQFDRAEIKGGQTVPIRSVIESVSSTGGDAAVGKTGDVGAPAIDADSAASGNAMKSEQAAPRPALGAPEVTGSREAPAAGTIVARSGSTVIRTTAILGVLLSANENGQPFGGSSGSLLGARQNVHLDSGTHIVLAVCDTRGEVQR